MFPPQLSCHPGPIDRVVVVVFQVSWIPKVLSWKKKYFNNYKYPCSLLKTLLWSSPVMDLKSTNTFGTSEVTWGSDTSSSS